jgi:S-adenosylmethionine decarboxylase
MKHLIGYVEGTCIEYIHQLQEVMDKIAEECEFTVVGSSFHQFDPIGVTGVLVLSESHFSAHTYPEHNKVYIDVFCCAPTFDPEYCSRIILKYFKGSNASWQVVRR